VPLALAGHAIRIELLVKRLVFREVALIAASTKAAVRNMNPPEAR
jgi:hypothetical protein